MSEGKNSPFLFIENVFLLMTDAELLATLNGNDPDKIVEQFDKIRHRLSQLEAAKKRGVRLSAAESAEWKLLNKYVNAFDDKVRDINKGLEKQKELQEKLSKGFDNMAKGAREVWRAGSDVVSAWGKADQAVANFMKSVGGSAEGMRRLRKEVINLVSDSHLAVRFGVDTEKMMKMMTSYTSSIGRNVQSSTEGMKSLAAMSAIFGDAKASEFVSRLENFGVSMQEAGRRSGQLFTSAARHGVSFEAYSKTFLNNIQMAQRYTFKDGLEGLSNMARKATEIQLNMQQTANFAEKVSTLEGAIGAGAQLQVLGGAFSAMADPLALLNESLNDMEGLQDRIARMYGGFAKMNKETGEIEVGAFDRQRIKAAAQASGMDFNELMKSVYTQGRRNEIARALSGRSDLTEDMKELITNMGSFEKGVAGININGKFKSINDITNADQQTLVEISRSESDDIKDIAVRLRGWEDTFTGAKKQIEATKAQAVEFENIGETIKTGIAQLGEIKWVLYGIAAFPFLRGGLNMARGAWQMTKAGGGTFWENAGKLAQGKWGIPEKGVTKVGRVGGRIVGTAAGGALIWNGISNTSAHDAQRKSGELERGTARSNNARFADMMKIWGGAGATIGSLIGGLPGMLIGGAIGAAGGAIHSAIKNAQDKKALESKNRIERNYGLSLSGDYRNKDMKTLTRALSDDGEISLTEFGAMSKRVQEQLLKSGDIDRLVKDKEVLEAIKSKYENTTIESKDTNMNVSGDVYLNGEKITPQKGANGGLLVGPSHAGGGMKIAHSNIEVEGGEFVVNKNATRKNIDLLTKINAPGTDIIKPRQMANGGMLTVAPTVSQPQSTTRQIDMKPLDINIRGSIKLEGAGGQSVDMMKTLLDNPSFVKEIAALIQKEIAIKADGGLIINKGLK